MFLSPFLSEINKKYILKKKERGGGRMRKLEFSTGDQGRLP
jgi:hypothetical protein